MTEGSSLRKGDLWRRITGLCGIVSQVCIAMAVAVPALNSPWFDWTKDHLSAFGVESSGSAMVVYNSGLILAGILGIVFVIGFKQHFLSGRLGLLAMAILILASASAATMGTFPRNWDFIHGASTVTFYVCIILGLLAAGVAAINNSQIMLGILSMVASILAAALLLIPGPLAGGGITQLLSCIPWSLWTIGYSIVLLRSPLNLKVDDEGLAYVSSNEV